MYKLTNSSSIKRLIDNAFIPISEDNSDYQTYLQWLAEGNTPEPVDLPTPEELAAIALEEKTIEDTIAAKSYAKLTALKGMSPAEIQTWMTNNVTTLAQARDALTTLAIAVSILARRL